MGLFKTRTYTDPARNTACTAFEVDNWTISDFVLDKLIPVVGTRPFPLSELSLMVATVCRFKPQLIFDWGTHVGKSARVFRETIVAFGIPAHIHSVDLPDDVAHVEHPQNERGKLVRGLREVTLHQGDGVATALDILAKTPGQRALFYVDGDHSYESVKREFGLILEKAPQAIVLLHDTFDQSAASGYNTGPYRAIQELLTSRSGSYQTISTTTGLPGMTLVYPEQALRN